MQAPVVPLLVPHQGRQGSFFLQNLVQGLLPRDQGR